MERLLLEAQPRTTVGTPTARRARRAGQIPAVVYGQRHQPVSLLVNQREFLRAVRTTAGENVLIKLKVAGESASGERTVLVKAIQHDPVSGAILHVDFHQVSLTERIAVHVPLVTQGEPVGVKQDGGILEHFLRDIEVECLPTDIPSHLMLDVSALKIGDALHVKDITPPSRKIHILTDAAAVVVSVLPPHIEKAPEVVEAAPTEPELIRKEKKAEEAAAAPAGEAKAEAKPEKPEAKKDKEKEGK